MRIGLFSKVFSAFFALIAAVAISASAQAGTMQFSTIVSNANPWQVLSGDVIFRNSAGAEMLTVEVETAKDIGSDVVVTYELEEWQALLLQYVENSSPGGTVKVTGFAGVYHTHSFPPPAYYAIGGGPEPWPAMTYIGGGPEPWPAHFNITGYTPWPQLIGQ